MSLPMTPHDFMASAQRAGRDALSSPLVSRARLFATAAHGAVGQLRTGSQEPYITHPQAVAGILALIGADEALQAAGWLHDVIDDTAVSRDGVEAEFGPEVASLVWAVSEAADGDEKDTRHHRKALAQDRLAKTCSRTQTLKLADILHNTSALENLPPTFAVLYLEEKKLEVVALGKGDSRLLEVVMAQLQMK